MNELLKGTYDLHVHTAPAVVPRKCSDVQLAERMRIASTARTWALLLETLRRLQ